MSNAKTVDHNSPIPFYVQLREILESLIGEGQWQSGERLPSEQELCNMYDVSRTVVRQTLQELERNGLIVKRKGKGSFVARPKIHESLVQKLTGFYQDMVERGFTPVTKVLHQSVEPVDAKVALQLELEPGTLIHNIERLRYVNDEPIVLVRTHVPVALCPDLADIDLSNQSLYAVLEDVCGMMLSHGRRTVEAVIANKREAQLLEMEEGDPLLLLKSVSYLRDGTPIEYFRALHRGDRSRFEVDLVRVREADEAKIVIGTDEMELPTSH